jgi:peptidoglycan hydrolase-like protein with peptidoglycan-binding domain
MEPLAYLHFALACEAPEAEVAASALDIQPGLSAQAVIPLLSLSVALGVLGIPTQALALMQQGDRGPDVMALQQRLQQLGYFSARPTGYFGSITKDAVMRFQRARGLSVDGIVGSNTEAVLGRQQNSPSTPVASNSMLRLGDRGWQVSAVQEGLATAGFWDAPINGIFDRAMQSAVVRFQQARGLSADGIVGPQTRAALPAIGGQPPSAPTDIRALQRRLQVRGFYQGSIDGIWGPQTQAAVEAAQRAYRVSLADLQQGRF